MGHISSAACGRSTTAASATTACATWCRRWRRGAGRRKPDTLGTQEFWALRDISLDVKPGEAVGIIGPNGAGKSTTLKLLTKILRPTKGRIEINGRVGALIEVAAGLPPRPHRARERLPAGRDHGDARARDRAQVRRDRRLLRRPGLHRHPGQALLVGDERAPRFAIAAHLDPDVLIIDEVLSVGDVGFQEKCVTRMRELLARGIPLVFVSHNLSAVVQLCTRAILVDRGAVQFDGRPADAVASSARAAAPRTRRSATADPDHRRAAAAGRRRGRRRSSRPARR
jgi:lipopolysaccharide transport system ATP-binding protein